MNSIDFTAYLNAYLLAEPYEVEQRESGMNNTTRIITSRNERYVLRIYNNHKDADIVRLEQEVLSALQQEELPFRIPVPILNKNGDTLSISEDGTLSALFHYIEGDRPEVTIPAHVHALGETAALLTSSLREIQPIRKPLYSPYYELNKTYASMDVQAFLAIASRSVALAARQSSFEMLQRERDGLAEICAELASWPMQWIHGDLVFNNTVSRGDAIIGVLDFEFATMDVRVMELAVIVVDLLKPNDGELSAKIKLLLKGYLNKGELTDLELQYLPACMKLRLIDVALHFAVRLNEGLDQEEVLCQIVEQSAFGCEWINEHWEDEIA
ncbi:phosphotransferase [Paenibacillus sinopodophylli]|uniref:phosphotransferase n=1 Tax=Paenibacillus sinopodophylli TaxID=1837342 RepID=UPI001486A7EF|nr:phosphotransferase [Paenibacillus sinopodophylli]